MYLFIVRVVNYVTNHVIAHVPSYMVRHFWCRSVLRIQRARDAGVHRTVYIWFYGPEGIRRNGARIVTRSRINRGCALDIRGGLTIRDNVSLSAEVSIVTIAKLAPNTSSAEAKPVVIEDDVWIGTRAVIMPGVTVGHGAVVAPERSCYEVGLRWPSASGRQRGPWEPLRKKRLMSSAALFTLSG